MRSLAILALVLLGCGLVSEKKCLETIELQQATYDSCKRALDLSTSNTEVCLREFGKAVAWTREVALQQTCPAGCSLKPDAIITSPGCTEGCIKPQFCPGCWSCPRPEESTPPKEWTLP